MASPLCLRHRTVPVAAVCHRCGEGLCDICWAFVFEGKPLCARCVREAEWRAELGWSRFVVFILVSIGLSFWLSRHVSSDMSLGIWIAVTLSVIVGLPITTAATAKAKRAAKELKRREAGTEGARDPLELPAHPFRVRLLRAGVAPDPTVSPQSALVVGLLLVVSAVLVPVSLKLPRWVEFELVLTVWWTLFFGLLTVILYRGARVREAHAFRLRWRLPELGSAKDEPEGHAKAGDRSKPGARSKGWDWLDIDPGCADADGCTGLVVGIVLSVIALAAAWFLIEVAFPTVFFLLYWLVVKATARVANDRHECEGSLDRSIAWGALWATLYTLPLALVVWGIHAILAARGHI